LWVPLYSIKSGTIPCGVLKCGHILGTCTYIATSLEARQKCPSLTTPRPSQHPSHGAQFAS
jgi:hypothetical protein